MRDIPKVETALKWDIPVYMNGTRNVCTLAAFKEHVGLNFFVPPSVLSDPKNKLEGGKTSRMVKVRSLSEIKDAEVRGWVKAAAAARES